MDDSFWEAVTRRDCEEKVVLELVSAATDAGTDTNRFLAQNVWLHVRVLYTVPPGSPPVDVLSLISWKDAYSYVQLFSYYPTLCTNERDSTPSSSRSITPFDWLSLRVNTAHFASVRQDTINLLARRRRTKTAAGPSVAIPPVRRRAIITGDGENVERSDGELPPLVLAWDAVFDVLRSAYDSSNYADVVCKHSSAVSILAAVVPTYGMTISIVNWVMNVFLHANSGFARAVQQLEFPPNRIAKIFLSFISLEAKMKSWIVSFHRDWYPEPAEVRRVVDLLATSSDRNMKSIPYIAPQPLSAAVMNMTLPDIVAAKAPWIAVMSLMEQQRLIREPFWRLVCQKASWRFVLLLFGERVFFSCVSSTATLLAVPMLYKTLSSLVVATKTRALDWIGYIAICVKLVQLVVNSRTPPGRTSRFRGSSTSKFVTYYVLTRLVLSIPVVGLLSRVLVSGLARGGCFVDGETARKLMQPGYFNELYRGDRTSLVGMFHSAFLMAVLRGGAHFFSSHNLLSSGNSLCYTTKLEQQIMNQRCATQSERDEWAERIVLGGAGSITGGWRFVLSRQASLAVRSALVAGVECVTSLIAVSVAVERQDLFVAARSKLVLDVLTWVIGYVAGRLAP